MFERFRGLPGLGRPGNEGTMSRYLASQII